MRRHPRAWRLTVGIFAAAVSLSSQSPRLSAADAVERYAAGDFETAVTTLNSSTRTGEFLAALDAWIANGDDAVRARRRLTATAFALDATWRVTRTFVNSVSKNGDAWGTGTLPPERWSLNSYQAQHVITVWAARQLAAIATPDQLSRWLWLATIGIAEDGYAWNRLEHEILPRALAQFPDDPRIRLTQGLARSGQHFGRLRRGVVRRNDILQIERGAYAGAAKAIAVLEPLRTDPVFGAEVELRLGYLELRRDRWQDALARFATAQATLTEPILIAASHYFSGFVHEQLQQRDAAIAAYRRALAITPLMRNLATRLSALLFERGDRTEAFAILDPAINARPEPIDLVLVVERAHARFVPGWLASIRKALQ